MSTSDVIGLFVLIGTANAAPIVARQALGDRLDRPVDGGRHLADGAPVFGPSKTWRGIVSALVLTTTMATVLGLPWTLGAIVAAAAMAGDLGASFCKRRLGRPSSAPVLGLDQIPESLLPALAARPVLGLDWSEVLGLTLAFLLAERLVSPVLYRLHLRRRPRDRDSGSS